MHEAVRLELAGGLTGLAEVADETDEASEARNAEPSSSEARNTEPSSRGGTIGAARGTETKSGRVRAAPLSAQNKHIHLMAVCPYATDTGMFAGAFTGPLSSGVAQKIIPMLPTHTVARAIAEGMETRKHFVVVPWFLSAVGPLLHLLPVPWYDIALRLGGAEFGMKTFTGRGKSFYVG